MMSTPMSFMDQGRNDQLLSSSQGSRSHMTGPAFESALAAYASRVLKKRSPPESVIDASVGPYVTSILRGALECQSGDDIRSHDFAMNVEHIPEYESLMELLEEHCTMNEDVAKTVLQKIAKAVVTGEFEDDKVRQRQSSFSGNGFLGPGIMGKYRSLSMGAENDYVGDRFRSLSMGTKGEYVPSCTSNDLFLGDFLKNSSNANHTGEKIEEEPSFLFEEDDLSGMEPMMGNLMLSPNTSTRQHTEEKSFLSDMPQSPPLLTPLKPDRLIPVDLLGVIDDPSTPYMHTTFSLRPSPTSAKAISTSPPTVETNSTTDVSNNAETGTTNSNSSETEAKNDVAKPKTNTAPAWLKKKKTKVKDLELAESLFSRPRSRSLHDTCDKSPKLKPMAPPPPSMLGISGFNCASASAMMNHSIPELFKKQLDSAVQILLAMNYDLCEQAAHEAALVSNADVNVAQHVIDGAVAAPPVCRHMLNDGCYRSDCQFSHDVDGHTCIFWLRGRCGKGAEGCRFMHGFSEKLLDGVDVDFRSPSNNTKQQQQPAPTTQQLSSSAPIAIKTGNLVQHNMRAFLVPSSAGGNSFVSPSNNQGSGSLTSFGMMTQNNINTPPLSDSPAIGKVPSPKNDLNEMSSSAPKTFSFASIASKGYSEKESFSSNNNNTSSGIGCALNSSSSSSSSIKHPCKTVRIPQNLWNAHHNRSSSAFHISDPLARYKKVSSSVQRRDVVDLHFQSVKTFPIVLSNVLPEKLRDHGQVWIVTGSGHHVDRGSHQKSGGVLENAVVGWLQSNDYIFTKGRDKNGWSGAVLVQGWNQ
mmetsp:Transcript_24463/g.27991  ORF Transcript_24463/g.27991 Transcript_24463/m.27991 type:complete len:807 (-) Transcript_24463:217-2637(-)